MWWNLSGVPLLALRTQAFFVQGLTKEYPMLVPLPFPLAGGKEGRHVDPEHHHFRRTDEDFGQP